ncbi:XdhC family protein [Romboutsia sp.]|uniref:XdhC family protein n=1 Tax=Romboutsia sp. TaxID=1965302 RepID=UPI003F3A12FB
MDRKILERISEELKKGASVAMATLTEVKGSSPGKQGAILCMFENESVIGTVGGGILEHKIMNKCKDCLEKNEDSIFEYNLNNTSKDTPMECGGDVKGYIKVFKPNPKLLIVGGGHIGFNIYKISRSLNFHTIVVDDREDYANEERFKEAEEVYSGEISKILKEIYIDKNTYVVITTRGYEKDLEALREVINNEVAYIGMIGSRKKWLTIKKELIKEGIKEDKLDEVYAPVGINISSTEVSEIAFGILAEILMIKNKGDLSHRKDKK